MNKGMKGFPGGMDDGLYRDYVPELRQPGSLGWSATAPFVGRWARIGPRTVHAWGFGSPGAAGTGNNIIQIGVPYFPVNALWVPRPIGTMVINDSGTGLYQGTALLYSDGYASTFPASSTSGSHMGVAPNFALATADSVWWSFQYEID